MYKNKPTEKNNNKEDCYFNYSFESNPTKLSFLENLPIKINESGQNNNALCLFKSLDNILVLSYFSFGVYKPSILSYNIIDKKIMHKITGFDGQISHLSHFSDKANKRDLLLQIVCGIEFNIKNNIYIWNFSNLECILCLESIYQDGYIYSASLLKENNQLYLIASNNKGKELSLPLKVFDIKGNKVKEIKSLKRDINYIDVYFDNKLKKYFIVLIDGTLSSYDYKTFKLYKKYHDKKFALYGDNIFIKQEKKIVKIMECDFNGYINIFNFHTGDLLFNARAGGYGFCCWNDNYLLATETYNRFILIDISSPRNKKYFEGHKETVYKIVKLIHPNYGECLITISQYETKLWIIKEGSKSRKKNNV